MSSIVTVVDYGRGNLFSLSRALEHLGASAKVTSDPAEVAAAERLILPGVGAFGDGMENLRARGLVESVQRYAASGRPLLGICLGMQLLLDESDEFGSHRGLGIVPGRVTRFADSPERSWKVPHVGWSRLTGSTGWKGSALAPLPEGERMYFVHSYHAVPVEPFLVDAVAQYGRLSLTAAVGIDNVFAVQFHPEKSQRAGLALLRAFLDWKC